MPRKPIPPFRQGFYLLINNVKFILIFRVSRPSVSRPLNGRFLPASGGAEGVISAETNGIKAEILIQVISRKIVEPPLPKNKSGLFKNFAFSSTADPRQRVKFERTNGQIIIALRAPSVTIYFGLDGKGQDEGHCQVMLAELVIEGVCREIARRKIESGKEPFLGEASEAMNVVHNRLINIHAAKIHNLLVDNKFHRN